MKWGYNCSKFRESHTLLAIRIWVIHKNPRIPPGMYVTLFFTRFLKNPWSSSFHEPKSVFVFFSATSIWSQLYLQEFKVFFLYMFLVNQWFIFVILSSVAPHRGQPGVKCHLRWQPTRWLAVSCGLGRCRDCRTTAWRNAIEPPRLPKIEPPLCRTLGKGFGMRPN